MEKPKHAIYDSVFTNMFAQPKYQLELFRVLHPDITDITEADLHNCTKENILVNGIYNDLSFEAGDRFIIFVEAQSTWSPNVIVRGLFYTAHVLHERFHGKNAELFSSRKSKMPKVEMYILVTCDMPDPPEYLSLRETYFPEEDWFLDLRAKVITKSNAGDIIDQYITFCKTHYEQKQIHGRTMKALEETIRICKEQNVLKDYLSSLNHEVLGMIKSLYDQEAIFDQYCEMVGKEREEKGEARGINIGEARGVIKLGRKLGMSLADTISNLAENFSCSDKEAEEIYYKAISSMDMATAV